MKIMWKFFIVFNLMVILLASCGGKKEIKKETEESKIAKEAFSVIETVKKAYTNKDLETILRHSTKEGAVSIIKDLKRFDTVELTFKPIFTEIHTDKVLLNVSWQGKWQKEGKYLEDKGMAVFILVDKPLKIDKILRTNPFTLPE
ncbi:MAG: hypothetical protein N2511_06260 [Thermodesulfovibrionales bacterium]|nr:hypothetical protein [Thermodesulfovibrionales bacterium]